MDKEIKDNVEMDTPIKKTRSAKKPKEKKPEINKRVALPITRVEKKTEIIKGIFGEFECTNYLPYEEKVALAIRIVEKSIILDEVSGRGYSSVNKGAEMTLGLVEEYTNIEVPKDGRYDFYAYLIASELTEAIWDVIYPDAWMIEEMAKVIRESAIDRFNHEHSIDYYFTEMSSGSQAGDDLLKLLNVASTNQNSAATKITNRIDELQQQSGNPVINLSKRKK